MKTPASAKRARLPRKFDYAPQFEKEWERLLRSGRFDMPRLKQLMLLLVVNDEPLAAEWKDHPLKGEWQDCRDCHVHGDFLLIYRLENEKITFVRAGTHADLFR